MSCTQTCDGFADLAPRGAEAMKRGGDRVVAGAYLLYATTGRPAPAPGAAAAVARAKAA